MLLLTGIVATEDSAHARSGYALRFDGVDDFVVMGDVLMLSRSNITVELWMRSVQTDDGCLLTKHETGGNNGYLLMINHRDWDNRAQLYAGEWNAIGTSPVNTGEWVHLAGVYDTIGASTIYVNGVPEDVGEAPPELTANTRPFRIGAFAVLEWGGMLRWCHR